VPSTSNEFLPASGQSRSNFNPREAGTLSVVLNAETVCREAGVLRAAKVWDRSDAVNHSAAVWRAAVIWGASANQSFAVVWGTSPASAR